MSIHGNCASCRFSAEHQSLQAGYVECRRFPPQVITDDDGPCGTAFPGVEGDLWCGEYAPKLNG